MEQTYINDAEFKVLGEFAKSTGRKLEFNEKMYNSSSPNRFPKYRTEVYIPDGLKSPGCFVCLYDSFYREGGNSLFSGVCMPVALPLTSTFNIRNKTIVDSWNSIFGSKSFKTGNSDFDAKVVVKGNDDYIMTRYISDSKFQHLVLKCFAIKPTIQIALNEGNVSFVPQLKNKSRFCIYDKQEWFLERKHIESLFELIEDFSRIMNKPVHNN